MVATATHATAMVTAAAHSTSAHLGKTRNRKGQTKDCDQDRLFRHLIFQDRVFS
jgi:hypothetical protein